MHLEVRVAIRSIQAGCGRTPWSAWALHSHTNMGRSRGCIPALKICPSKATAAQPRNHRPQDIGGNKIHCTRNNYSELPCKQSAKPKMAPSVPSTSQLEYVGRLPISVVLHESVSLARLLICTVVSMARIPEDQTFVNPFQIRFR